MCLTCDNTGQIYDENRGEWVECPRCSRNLHREEDLLKDTETGRERKRIRG